MAKKRWLRVGKKKYGFRFPKNISVGFERRDIFRGADYGIGLFYIMAHYRTAILLGCLHKRGGSAKRTYNAALCNLASDVLHTGTNETVVVVGVQCLFALFFWIGTALCHPQERGWQCAVCIGKNNAKSMTVANGGNAIACSK